EGREPFLEFGPVRSGEAFSSRVWRQQRAFETEDPVWRAVRDRRKAFSSIADVEIRGARFRVERTRVQELRQRREIRAGPRAKLPRVIDGQQNRLQRRVVYVPRRRQRPDNLVRQR